MSSANSRGKRMPLFSPTLQHEGEHRRCSGSGGRAVRVCGPDAQLCSGSSSGGAANNSCRDAEHDCKHHHCPCLTRSRRKRLTAASSAATLADTPPPAPACVRQECSPEVGGELVRRCNTVGQQGGASSE